MARLISGVFEINGEIVTVGPDGATPVDAKLYDDNGWSLEMQHGCVRSKAVDEFLAAAENSDQFDKELAASAPRWFAMFVPDRDYIKAERKQISLNYNQDGGSKAFASGYTGALILAPFYPDIQRDESDTRPPFTYVTGERLNRHATPIFGFAIYDVHKLFDAQILGQMASGVDIARRNAAFAAQNPNAVRPGQ